LIAGPERYRRRNQRSYGLLTIAELFDHRRMRVEMARWRETGRIYYCPHDKEPPCACRKPSPGMLLTAAREHQIDLGASWMVGNSDSDIEAGRRAGCHTIRILADPPAANGGNDHFARSLLEASGQVLAGDKVSRTR
jgi:D-glycero-D-manno-heptose 1,7-bisphosphate phosphatase